MTIFIIYYIDIGHQIADVTGFYQQHADAVEIAKVSQILLLAEAGKLHLSAGKTINNLDISELFLDADDDRSEKCSNRRVGNIDSEDEDNPFEKEPEEEIEVEEEKEEKIGNHLISERELLFKRKEADSAPMECQDIKDIDNKMGKYVGEGMLNVQNVILNNIGQDIGNIKKHFTIEKEVPTRRIITEEEEIKEVQKRPLVDQISALEGKNKRIKLSSNEIYMEEKRILLERYADKIKEKVVPRMAECEIYLNQAKNRVIINWRQMKEILGKEVVKERMKDPRYACMMTDPRHFHVLKRTNFAGRF